MLKGISVGVTALAGYAGVIRFIFANVIVMMSGVGLTFVTAAATIFTAATATVSFSFTFTAAAVIFG